MSHSHRFKILILLYTTIYNPQIISPYFSEMLFVTMFLWYILYIHNLITCHYYKWLIYNCPLPWALLAFCIRGIILTSLSCPITLFNEMWEEVTYVSFEPQFWVIACFNYLSCSFPLPRECHVQVRGSSFKPRSQNKIHGEESAITHNCSHVVLYTWCYTPIIFEDFLLHWKVK